MKHPVKAWVLEEKTGGRKGKWMPGSGIPFHYPIKVGLFLTRGDAITFMRNSKTEDKYKIVCVEVFIKRREEDVDQRTDTSDSED
jgi:hypothetical protein